MYVNVIKQGGRFPVQGESVQCDMLVSDINFRPLWHCYGLRLTLDDSLYPGFLDGLKAVPGRGEAEIYIPAAEAFDPASFMKHPGDFKYIPANTDLIVHVQNLWIV